MSTNQYLYPIHKGQDTGSISGSWSLCHIMAEEKEKLSKGAETGVCGTTLPLITVVGICGNLATVVGVVIMNKYIQKEHGLNAMIFLSFCHFVVTAVGIRLLLCVGFFKYKAARARAVAPVALGSLGSVAFMNLNLAHNTVGFYQISKLACIPVTLALGYLVDGIIVPFRVKVTLLPLVFGMGFATVHDVEASFVGTAYAAAAVLCTVASQTFTSSLQRSLGCDSNQLLYHTSPLIAVGMLALCPIFDDLDALYAFEWTYPVVRDVAISCFLALGVNITNYLVLGKTSPLTYQVIGHLKTIFTIAFGVFVLHHPTNPKNLLGVSPCSPARFVLFSSVTLVVRRSPSLWSASFPIPKSSVECSSADSSFLNKTLPWLWEMDDGALVKEFLASVGAEPPKA